MTICSEKNCPFELLCLSSVNVFQFMFVSFVNAYQFVCVCFFSFWFGYGVWDLIVLVTGDCLPVYLSYCQFQSENWDQKGVRGCSNKTRLSSLADSATVRGHFDAHPLLCCVRLALQPFRCLYNFYG